jgi:hypothetical protein
LSVQPYWSERQRTLESYLECDPDVLAQRETETKTLIEQANRWTDNLYVIRSYVQRNLGVDLDLFDQQFELKPALQYLE